MAQVRGGQRKPGLAGAARPLHTLPRGKVTRRALFIGAARPRHPWAHKWGAPGPCPPVLCSLTDTFRSQEAVLLPTLAHEWG